MKNLGVTAEEAEEILATDKAIDRGDKVEFDLTPEQEKATRKYRQADRKQSGPVKRERKENPTKAGIIAELSQFLENGSQNAVENLEITNKERQIRFTIGGEIYELTLVQKRKPKN